MLTDYERQHWIKIYEVCEECSRGSNCSHPNTIFDYLTGIALSFTCGYIVRFKCIQILRSKCHICEQPWILTNQLRQTCYCALMGKLDQQLEIDSKKEVAQKRNKFKTRRLSYNNPDYTFKDMLDKTKIIDRAYMSNVFSAR